MSRQAAWRASVLGLVSSAQNRINDFAVGRTRLGPLPLTPRRSLSLFRDRNDRCFLVAFSWSGKGDGRRCASFASSTPRFRCFWSVRFLAAFETDPSSTTEACSRRPRNSPSPASWRLPSGRKWYGLLTCTEFLPSHELPSSYLEVIFSKASPSCRPRAIIASGKCG